MTRAGARWRQATGDCLRRLEVPEAANGNWHGASRSDRALYVASGTPTPIRYADRPSPQGGG